MLDLTEEILRELVQIKWALICLVTMYWGKCLYFLSKEIPSWLKSFSKEKEPSPIERRHRDLGASTRVKQDCPDSQWD